MNANSLFPHIRLFAKNGGETPRAWNPRKKRTRASEHMHQAMMNIFEDLSLERAGNVETQKAVMNILEDLQEEIVAKNRFLAVLSHELRNPLAPITSTLEYIKLRGIEDEDLRENIEIIEHQFSVLTRLLKDLLDVARISSNKLQPNFEKVHLQAVIARAVHATKSLVERVKHSLSISLPQDPVWLVADPLRLEQVIINLLSNAIKYTEPGGTIWLIAKVERSGIILEVRDTGVGINPQMVSRIFNLFTQGELSTTRFGGGLGVGLALVRALVELHGGTVHATSEGNGHGSLFTVRLPFVPPHYVAPQKS